ncbi:MAG: branched-chain amino acid ABC transporter permease [Variovorax sp.]
MSEPMQVRLPRDLGAPPAVATHRRPFAKLDRTDITSIAALLGLLLLPVFGGGYWTYTLGLCFANAIAIISVSFMVRYAGEVSIGHGVFVAVGAYTVAMIERYFGLSLIVSLPVAALASGLLGAAFAYLSRPLAGITLAVATMALALALPEILLYFARFTGGFEGLYVKLDALPGIAKPVQRYYVPLIGLAVVVLLLRQFRHSGQAMSLLLNRTSATAAESFGVQRGWARVCSFTLSAGLAGVAGALLSFCASTVSPNSFTLWTSIFLLVGSVVSLHALSLIGAVIGGIFLTLVPLQLAGAGDWVPVLYGAALLIVVLVANTLPQWLKAHRNRGAGR